MLVNSLGCLIAIVGAATHLRAAEPIMQANHVLIGRVTAADGADGVGYATVWLPRLERGVSCDETGAFVLSGLPSGACELQVRRIGFQDAILQLNIGERDTTRVTIELRPAGFQTDEVVVSASLTPTSAPDDAVLRLEGAALRDRLGITMAQTLRDEPGIAEQSMGPAPARPVLRGLGGDRLLLLEDGAGTGDLSASSADHAVAIEPLHAANIEVIRGPRALLYASQALGGVVNVQREKIPRSTPAAIGGELTLQGESVNSGASTAARLQGPLGPVALRADFSLRSAGDIRTPLGELVNTQIQTSARSFGAAINGERGSIGAAVNSYHSEYGIPPDPEAGHPGGASIELDRYGIEARADWQPASNLINVLRADVSMQSYEHVEFEASGAAAVLFRRNSLQSGLQLLAADGEVLRGGTFGLEYTRSDRRYDGLVATSDAIEQGVAATMVQALHLSDVTLQAALRADVHQIDPEEAKPSRTVGNIRSRTFSGISAALEARTRPIADLSFHAGVMTSFRPPTGEELFSEGPHLAAYSFEVGNADLEAERGLGLEVGLEFRRERVHAGVTAFRNSFSGYIYPRNTGERSTRRGDLYLYQFSGEDAVMTGAEVQAGVMAGRSWRFSANLAFVTGELSAGGNLPMIPPATLHLEAGRQIGDGEAGIRLSAAAAQRETGEFESPTAGYVVVDAFAGWNATWLGALHAVNINVSNLLDHEYRRHLNRVRHVMPEPGRSLRFLYRLYL